MSLNEEILTQVQSAKLTDSGQRAALGMARMWMEHGEVKHSQQMTGFAVRDQLAEDLVAILKASGAPKEQMIDALAYARAKVNEPFVDPNMLGWQAKRVKAGAVGSDKKNEKLGLD